MTCPERVVAINFETDSRTALLEAKLDRHVDMHNETAGLPAGT